MDDKLSLLRAALGEVRVKENEEIKYHTFSKLGGPAEFFYLATSQKEFIEVLNICRELKVPIFVIGSGTKVMVSEEGLKGMVIKNRSTAIKMGAVKGKVSRDGLGVEEAQLDIDSGTIIGRINEYLRTQNLREIEGISSVHSSLGGSIFLDPNIIELAEVIKVWQDGDVFEIPPFELKRNKHIVLSVVLRIKAV